MTAKVWQFLLPETGSHTVRVVNVGTDGQQIEVDGLILETPGQRTDFSSSKAPPSFIFSGPGSSMCELKAQGKDWILLVNGLLVEDYTSSRRENKDESLRNLRSRPEGSYLIQTEIPSENFDLHVIRKFRFVVQGVLREVQVAHWDWIWQIMLDGKIVDRVAHNKQDELGDSHFEVRTEDGVRLPADIQMFWQPRMNIWKYRLYVAGIEVPMCWSKATGDIQPPSEPPVIGDDVRPPPPPSPDADTAEPEQAAAVPVVLDALPQGVSYDASTGLYQANIRSSTGRFVFLGEFSTVEEAHQRYVEAIPQYNPGRAVVS